MAISTSTHPKLLWPGLQAIWGDYFYDRWPDVAEMCFDATNSKKKFEEDVQVSGFGLMPVKTEGQSVAYDTENQGFVTRYTHVAYALGFVVTHEELMDNQYMEVGSRRAKGLAFSGFATKQTVAANILNRAETAGYTVTGGQTLLATAHPNTAGGTWANKASSDADLSEASLEDMLILISNATNDRGLNVPIRGEKLIVPPNECFNAERILMSNLRSGTANNDLNAVKAKGLLPGGYVDWQYLTDTDSWFIKTDVPNGAKFIWREKPSFTQDNDFDTMNARAKQYMRFSVGVTDPRVFYGSMGA